MVADGFEHYVSVLLIDVRPMTVAFVCRKISVETFGCWKV